MKRVYDPVKFTFLPQNEPVVSEYDGNSADSLCYINGGISIHHVWYISQSDIVHCLHGNLRLHHHFSRIAFRYIMRLPGEFPCFALVCLLK